MTKKRYRPQPGLVVFAIVVALLAGFVALVWSSVGEEPPAETSGYFLGSVEDETDIQNVATYYWYDSGTNNQWTCYLRGEKARRVIRGPGYIVECRKAVYPGRNTTIGSI